MEKKCTKCNIHKHLDLFHKQKDGKYGRRSRCKECHIIENREYNSNPLDVRKRNLSVRYNMTPSDYNKLHEKQKGKCAICKQESKGLYLCVDHCHTTSKIRGLLCSTCNTGLGKFKDSIKNLKSAIKYLEESKK